MSRENDKKIAEWLGWVQSPVIKSAWNKPDGQGLYLDILPNYTTSDSDAIILLPVLVERGYCVALIGSVEDNSEMTPSENIEMTYQVAIDYHKILVHASTISKAITSAVLQLIEKEEKE